MKEISNDLNEDVKVVSESHLNELLKPMGEEIFLTLEKISPQDVIMYIYTSGTTGLPKPAIIKQIRYCAVGFIFFDLSKLTRADIVYVTLPIYHANGALIGVGAAVISGATVVLRNKFSASKFWSECMKHNCTAFIYVGEICRYLVNQPPSLLDQRHSIRTAIGNGLRENVWKEFNKRFGVKCVEFYSSSEGNCTTINFTSKIGSCGFIPLINKFINLLPTRIIRIDEQAQPLRDKNGFCIECKPGEKGLIVGIIGKTAKTSYSGYANNQQASNKKIIDNLFRNGQKAFNSGDLMMYDRYGYTYFCDRLGDTFRWRGENVATVEVENILSKNLSSQEVVVYGVELPGQEGRAGMAAIVKSDLIDLAHLTARIKAELPSYSRPLFIRIVDEIDHTGTFKAKKSKLIEEAYNVNSFGDKVYYFNTAEQEYRQLTSSIYQDIRNGNYSF
jgi:solute carrier family 27 fatty acid transporter 1/4